MGISRKKTAGALSILAISSLLLSACGQPPAEPGAGKDSAAGANKFLACMVSDEGGFDDRAFNQIAYEGLTRAASELGIETAEAQSKTADDYKPNLNAMVNQGCNLVISVGFMIADATQEVSKAHPDTKFAIIDVDRLETKENLLQIDYDAAQAAFLGGYAAAAKSTSGKVATFGGGQIPSVTVFMDGFAEGIKYFNEQKNANVQLLGWNVQNQTGEFVGNFSDQTKANQITAGFLAQGADLILPVAGPLYQGAAEAIRSDGNRALIIGVDSDLRTKEPGYSDIIFTSVEKRIDLTVMETIEDALHNDFSGGKIYTGTLANDGVGLSGFGEFASKLPAGLADELENIRQKIVDGSIKVMSQSSPKTTA